MFERILLLLMLQLLRHFEWRNYQTLPSHFHFSKLIQKINDEQQRAIFSYMALNCILDSSKNHDITQTIREKIHSQTFIKDILFDIAQKTTNRQEKIQNLQQIGMSSNLLKQTLAAFDINGGFYPDLVTFDQARFTNALSPNGKMVLFPTVETGKIIKALLNQSQRIVVSGGKGTGKSFSYLTYSHITEPLIQLRLNAANRKGKISEQFYRYVPKKQFQRIRKLFYIPLSKMQTTAQFITRLKFQCPLDVDFSPKDKEKEIDVLKQVTSRITQYYFDKRILSVCVLDQSNSYFSQFRRMIVDQNQDSSRLKFYSSNLESIGNSFYLLLYNSSQSFQSNMINNWNKANPNNPYNNPYMHQRNQGSDLRLRFSQNFDQISKHLELYNTFWDELCKYYPSMRVQQNNFARKCFQYTFGFPKKGENIEDNKNFIYWTLDVRHLNIRNVLQNRIKPQQSLQNTKNQKFSHLLSKQFLQLKNKILSQRQLEITTALQSYYAKAISNKDRIVRYAILSEIRSTALKQNIAEDRLCFSIINLDHILKKYNLKYQKDFKSQITHFTQLIGSGYNVKDTVCRIPITVQIVRFITTLTDGKFSQVSQLISKYLLQGALTPILAGNFLDMLHFFLFQEYKNMRLIIKHNQKQKLRQYYVANTVPFQVRSIQNMYLPKQLKRVLQEADKFALAQNWVLAHQATIFKNQRKDTNGNKGNKSHNSESIQNRNYQMNSLNPIFDYVLVKRQSDTKKRQYVIHSYHLTIGGIDKKVSQMKYSALCEQIKCFYKYEKIRVKWSHYIIGTLENFTKFSTVNHTGTYQTMFMNNYVSNFIDLNQQQVQEIVCTLEIGLASGFEQESYLNVPNGVSSEYKILFHKTITSIINQLGRVKMYIEQQDDEENNNEYPVQEIK